MKLAFIVDPLEKLDPSGDTSVAMIEAALQAGHDPFVVTGGELSLVDGRARAPLRRITLMDGRMDGVRWIAPSDWHRLDAAPTEPIALDDMDAVFLRTDPPLDRRYLWATWILDAVDPARTILVNDPGGIRDANEKLFSLRFRDLVPPTLISADREQIRAFLDVHGCVVLKPIDGHAGRGVLRLTGGDPNVSSMVELATARGRQPVVIQAWVHGAERGNHRILLWDGEVLGAVNRPVEPDDFRTGSPAEAIELSDRERHIVARLAPELRRRGLRFVGLDTIGDWLIEVNVTSAGGIRQAIGLGFPTIARDLIDAVELEARRRAVS